MYPVYGECQIWVFVFCVLMFVFFVCWVSWLLVDLLHLMNKNIIPTFFQWNGYVPNELLACTIWGVVFVPFFSPQLLSKKSRHSQYNALVNLITKFLEDWKDHMFLSSHPHTPGRYPECFTNSLWRNSCLCGALGKFGVFSQGMCAKSLNVPFQTWFQSTIPDSWNLKKKQAIPKNNLAPENRPS